MGSARKRDGTTKGRASAESRPDGATEANAGAHEAAARSRPATIRDVAALSGVSIATVTRTFQGSPRVRPETSARVRESARALDYRPDSIARTLVTGTSHTIGMLIPSLVEPYWAEIADAIERRAAAHHYSVLLASSRRSLQQQQQMLEMFFDKRVDGVIVGGLSSDISDWPRRRPQTPLVLLGWDDEPRWDLLGELSEAPLSPRLRRLSQETITGDWLAHVSSDDVAGGALIVRHLLELGHSRFAFLVCPPVRSYLLRLLGVRLEMEPELVGF